MVQGDPCHFIGIAIHCFDYIVQTQSFTHETSSYCD